MPTSRNLCGRLVVRCACSVVRFGAMQVPGKSGQSESAGEPGESESAETAGESGKLESTELADESTRSVSAESTDESAKFESLETARRNRARRARWRLPENGR